MRIMLRLCGRRGLSLVIFQIVRKPALVARCFAVPVNAAIRRADELSRQPGSHLSFHWRASLSNPHLDAVMGQVVERALSNTGGNQYLNVLLTQPARE